MLGWLEEITFRNGEIPHFNDSSSCIAFSTEQLRSYANLIGLKKESTKVALNESGYRKLSNCSFEIVVDVEGIEPSYQPGHAHSDHLSFVLYIHSKPFIIDPGISTYNIGKRRQWERSSEAHNSVTIGNNNVSEVWGGFRVGRRPKVKIIKEGVDFVSAQENYQIGRLKIEHTRSVELSDSKILISDKINSSLATSRLYLHPSISVLNDVGGISFSNGATIAFENAKAIEIEDYLYNQGYNSMLPANVIVVTFEKYFSSEIIIDK